MIEIKQKIQFSNGAGGRRRISKRTAVAELPNGRVPRISKLMALAIRFEGLIRNGSVKDQSELAQLAKVTQPRMTQIMNLLHLAPDIQEEILFLPIVPAGRDPIHEKMLRRLVAELDWQRQRKLWTKLTESES